MAICSMLVAEPETIPSSQRRPQANSVDKTCASLNACRANFISGDAERDEDLSGFPGRPFLPRDRQQLTICRMRFFLSACGFESNDQSILVYINADYLLGNRHAAIVRGCAARSWPAVLGHKMLIHRFDNDVFDVGCGNAGDRSDRYRLGLAP